MPLSLLSSVVPRFLSRKRALQEPTSQLLKLSPTEALHHYSTPGITPPSARIDSKLKLAARRPPRVWEYWKYAAVAASKATHITSELVSHTLWGPRRKTWGIEMTLVTSLVREMERHADLATIDLLRMVISLGGLVPLPSDALVTPVTFRVTKRNLRGILAEWDALETGERELHGEWVVGRKTWQRLQHEWKNGSKLGGESPGVKERVILYIHGGAYYLSSAAVQRIVSIPLAKYADARVFALDYRLAPETCFPGPLHDVVSGYMRLVEDLRIPSENIILAGDSAGGALCLALMLYLRDNSQPLPAAAILMSPWCDLTLSCESWDSNAAYDVVPLPPDNHMNPVALYLGEHMEKYLTHPYVSPLFGDMTGLPPLLIQAGDAEVLRDEVALLAHKASLAGVQVKHELYEDAIHVFQMYPFLDCTKRAYMSIHQYVKHTLPQIQSRPPRIIPCNAEADMKQEIRGNATIVSGDGTEMPSGEEQLRNFGTSALQSSSVPLSDGNDDKEVPPSWIRSPSLSRKRFSLDEKHRDLDLPELEIIEQACPISRIPDISLSPAPELSSNHHHHRPLFPRRHKSHSLLRHPIHTASPQETPSEASPRVKTPSSFTMTPLNNPQPAIRLSAKRGSHPDLTHLVESWSRAGPANETLLYQATTH
ncbi:hypothetical protein D9611_005577 [Ephemerocybe angulata]|uniref:Alpha/beta hydrolase fold-3 domain-containing protein n=1 Tax=Ephemerocybe angulata TaxID=980116 RepID=A0A8H5F4K8_9AGAR|nr:hypothetical protein D9611_005577 [Tulosesus angulatus]